MTPDTLDLELQVLVPNARVTVVGAAGAPESDIRLTVRAVQRVGDEWRVS